METKTSVLRHVDELVAYAASKGKDAGKLQTLIDPLRSAITGYYSVDIGKSVSKAIEAIIHGSIRTGIVYEDGSSAGSGGSAPPGWDDVRALFTAVDKSLMETTKEVFNASINEVTPPMVEAESDPPEPYYESNLVNAWINTYSGSSSSIIASLVEITKYGNSIGLDDVLQTLLEPKEIKEVPNLVDIAKDIYLVKGYKELIQLRELDIYIPTSVGGVNNG